MLQDAPHTCLLCGTQVNLPISRVSYEPLGRLFENEYSSIKFPYSVLLPWVLFLEFPGSYGMLAYYFNVLFAFLQITFNCVVAYFSDTTWLLVIYWNLIDACVYVMAVVHLLL